MDITRLDPEAAYYLWYAHRRNNAACYQKLAASLPADPGWVLDVGCGDGLLALELAARAAFVVGLDISPTMIAFARERQVESGKTNTAWVVARAEAPPFCAQSFDHVVSCMALRLSNMELSLPNLRRLVVPGGRIVVVDNVSPPPLLGFWPRHIWGTARRLPSLHRYFGWHGMWRAVKYRFSPAGVRNACASSRITPDSFMDIYRRHFPESDQRLELVPGRLVWENRPKQP